MPKTQTHLSLDGNALRVSRYRDLTNSADTPATSRGVFSAGRQRVELTSGPIEFGECTATQVTGIKLTDAFTIDSGTVRIGAKSEEIGEGLITHSLFASWAGQRWSLSGPFYGAMANRDVALQWFLDLTLEENDLGLVARPHSASLNDVSIMKVIPGFGVTETFVSRSAPPGGKQVSGGVAFRENAGPEVQAFRIFSSNADTSIIPINDVSAAGVVIEDYAPEALVERVASRLDDIAFEWV